jgi:hypothetical protein
VTGETPDAGNGAGGGQDAPDLATEAELDALMDQLENDWSRETGAAAGEGGGGAARAGPAEGPAPGQELDRPALDPATVAPAVEVLWGWGWKKAARSNGVDPSEAEFQAALEDSDTAAMAEALAAILDRWIGELVGRYPNLNKLLVAVTVSAIPLASYINQHGDGGEEEAPEEGPDVNADPTPEAPTAAGAELGETEEGFSR